MPPAPDPVLPSPGGLFAGLVEAMVGVGDWTIFATRTATGLLSRNLKGREVLRSCVEVGASSVGVIVVTGLFIGMVLAVQAYYQFHQIGLDTSLAILDALYDEFRDPNYAAVPTLRRMVAAGHLGRKSGVGFHDYRK